MSPIPALDLNEAMHTDLGGEHISLNTLNVSSLKYSLSVLGIPAPYTPC